MHFPVHSSCFLHRHLLFPKILGMRGFDPLSVLGASDIISQVIEAVGEGH